MIKNENKSYTATIEVDQTPEEVFSHITDVSKWWSRDFEGHSAKLNDEFIILHAGAHYSKQKLFEVIPDEKIVWLAPKGDTTELQFIHKGLVPGKRVLFPGALRIGTCLLRKGYTISLAMMPG